ncbi:MAG: TIGR03364 family FAD-dependent oxidoreductase, partial [Verrucomicrobia bacterium]|nr:TIGR03364 family FAD-dependent oxidoreductase [Cytophagales bacterium]
MATHKTEIAIAGAGIVGLAMAYTAARQGLKVTVFERSSRAVGASIRNFGMIWPIGQTAGKMYARAIKSRATYLELAPKAGFWLAENGSLHLAHHADEMAVLEEFVATAPENEYKTTLLTGKHKIVNKSAAVKTENLLGALWSETELNVDSREVIAKLPAFLEKEYGVEFHFDTGITDVSMPYFKAGDQTWTAEKLFICSGADFETLYPQVFTQAPITKCKLQMMRTVPQVDNWRIGASLCGGLTLLHYSSFKHCQSLQALNQRIEQTMPDYKKFGIHVLVSQNGLGEVILGDSHEYGQTPDPFDKDEIDQLVLKYLDTFAYFPQPHIAARWHGIYPKLTDGSTDFVHEPEKDVLIING